MISEGTDRIQKETVTNPAGQDKTEQQHKVYLIRSNSEGFGSGASSTDEQDE